LTWVEISTGEELDMVVNLIFLVEIPNHGTNLITAEQDKNPEDPAGCYG
jgi:hypothetical protein